MNTHALQIQTVCRNHFIIFFSLCMESLLLLSWNSWWFALSRHKQRWRIWYVPSAFQQMITFFPLDIKNIFKHLEPASDCAWEGAMECKLDVCLISHWQRHLYSKEFLSRRDKIVWNIVILKIVYWEQACHSCDMHLKRTKFNQNPESALLI